MRGQNGLFTHDFPVYSLLADLISFVPFGILLYSYCTFAFVFYIALIQVFFLGVPDRLFAPWIRHDGFNFSD